MRPLTLIDALQAVIKAKQAGYIWGPPGVGKSDIVRHVSDLMFAEQAGLTIDCEGNARDKSGKYVQRPYFIDLRAVLLDPVDLRGLPTISKSGKATWATPDFLPSEGQGVIFLDELAQAPPLVQAALLQLTLDRRIGDYVLPEGWTIIAASNRQEDRAGGHRLISPLMNRFLHLDIDVHVDDWQDWALSSNIRPEVRAYIKSRPNHLHKFDASVGARAFPTPRSWAFVSRVLAVATDDTLYDLVSGCIGQGTASEFVAFAKVYRSLPDVDAILKSPQSAPVPSEPDVLYAVTSAVVEKVRGAKGSNCQAAVTYAGRLPKEFGILLFRDLCKVDTKTLATDAGRAFLKANRDCLIAN